MNDDVWEEDNGDQPDIPGDSSDLKKLQETHVNVFSFPKGP
jgi:hypothetical protein